MKYYSQVAKDMDEKGVIDYGSWHLLISLQQYLPRKRQNRTKTKRKQTGSEEKNADQTNGPSGRGRTQAADTPESSDINGSSDSNNSRKQVK